MSIQSEIDRIRENISASYAAVEEKGGAAPELQSSGNLPGAIRSIETGAKLPSGTAGQVIGFDADGTAVAQALANDMLPVVDTAHGGTGKNTPAKAMSALISPCAQVNLTSASQMEGMYVPAANSTEAAGKIHLKNLRLAMVGGESPIVNSATDYTASRARAVSLHTTMPTTGLVNGCLYGIYS